MIKKNPKKGDYVGYYFGPDGPGTNVPPPPFRENGQAIHYQGEPRHDEFLEFDDPSELIESQSPFNSVEGFLTNQRINRLIEEKKITINEAESTRRQTKNMNFIEKEQFLSAIEHKKKS